MSICSISFSDALPTKLLILSTDTGVGCSHNASDFLPVLLIVTCVGRSFFGADVRKTTSSSVKDRSKEESEKMAEENQMLREELKKQQESTIRSEAECSAYKAMHEQLLKKLMERRE